MASTCSRVGRGGSGGLAALLFASLFSTLVMRFLVLAIGRIDEISKKGMGDRVDRNNGR
jgi:hypothetical protein